MDEMLCKRGMSKQACYTSVMVCHDGEVGDIARKHAVTGVMVTWLRRRSEDRPRSGLQRQGQRRTGCAGLRSVGPTSILRIAVDGGTGRDGRAEAVGVAHLVDRNHEEHEQDDEGLLLLNRRRRR